MADLYPLRVPPGVFRNGTEYQTKGRWWDCNLIRFYEGIIQPIGGWTPLLVNSPANTPFVVEGVPRSIAAWQKTGGRPYFAVGSAEKVYAYSIGVAEDITPAGFTPGRENTVPASGQGAYGKGLYGALRYGRGVESQGQYDELDLWQFATFGSFLLGLFVPSVGRLHYWTGQSGTKLIPIPEAPINCRSVVVTPERFILLLGADDDPRKVSWPDQESLNIWTPTDLNQAGSYVLEGKGRLMAGMAGRTETLIWTDDALFIARYIGQPYIYSFEKRQEGCGLIAPNAKGETEKGTVWMGARAFYIYDGFVRELPSEVADYVFSDFNFTQRLKVTCDTNSNFGEATWRYCSAGSDEIDRYVTWNARQNLWYFGSLARSCGVDFSTALGSPVLFDPAGNAYLHETGTDRDGLLPFIECGPVEVGDGTRILRMTKMIPDDKTLGDTAVTIFGREYPTAAERTFGPYTSANPTSVRVAARQVRVRISQATADDWRVGVLRFEGVPGERR